MKRITWKRAALLALALGVVGFLTATLLWTRATRGPSDIALAALQTGDRVRVSQADDVILFKPVGEDTSTGFILYPGAGVDHRSYSPLAQQIAEPGYLVALVQVPLNIAFFGANAPDMVIEAHPDIKHWVVGGHSLGGVVAANYAMQHPKISGLIFWGSYPAGDALKDADLSVLSIYGSHDGLTSIEQIDQSRLQLPQNAAFVEIEGGNHSQFGSYGIQPGDNQARISAEDQWSQIADATVAFLAAVSQ